MMNRPLLHRLQMRFHLSRVWQHACPALRPGKCNSLCKAPCQREHEDATLHCWCGTCWQSGTGRELSCTLVWVTESGLGGAVRGSQGQNQQTTNV